MGKRCSAPSRRPAPLSNLARPLPSDVSANTWRHVARARHGLQAPKPASFAVVPGPLGRSNPLQPRPYDPWQRQPARTSCRSARQRRLRPVVPNPCPNPRNQPRGGERQFTLRGQEVPGSNPGAPTAEQAAFRVPALISRVPCEVDVPPPGGRAASRARVSRYDPATATEQRIDPQNVWARSRPTGEEAEGEQGR